ncbi:hypothetical protein SK128_012666 [Halocaridina rubra]|uniref:Myb-like domain-containing protein n=1 Tax=Halocaridina rubra TaxID=373956 RepID=A0AAN8XA26_HALRR
MRRMKIRATPNFGGGGTGPRLTQPRTKSPAISTDTQTSPISNKNTDYISKDILEEGTSNFVPEITLDSTTDNEKEEIIPIYNETSSRSQKDEYATPDVACMSESSTFDIVCVPTPLAQSPYVPKESVCSSTNTASNSSSALKKEIQVLHSNNDSNNEKSNSLYSSQRKPAAHSDISLVNINDAAVNETFSGCEVTDANILKLPAEPSPSDKISVSDSLPNNTHEEIKIDSSVSTLKTQRKQNINFIKLGGTSRNSPTLVKGNTRRPKIHAKPSVPGANGRKTPTIIKREIMEANPSSDETPLDNTLSVYDCHNEKNAYGKDNNSDSVVPEPDNTKSTSFPPNYNPKLIGKTDIEVNAEIHSRDSRHNDIQVEEKLNEGSDLTVEEVKSKPIIRRPRIMAKPSIFTSAAKKGGSHNGNDECATLKGPKEIVLDSNEPSPATEVVQKASKHVQQNLSVSHKLSSESKKKEIIVEAEIHNSKVEKEVVCIDKRITVSEINDECIPLKSRETLVHNSEIQAKRVCLANRNEAALYAEVLEDEQRTVNQELEVVKDTNQNSKIKIYSEKDFLTHNGSGNSNNMRRSKIRAKPAFCTKRKGSVITGKEAQADWRGTQEVTEKVKQQESPSDLKGKETSVLDEVVQSPRKISHRQSNFLDDHNAPSLNSSGSERKIFKPQLNLKGDLNYVMSDDSCDDKENASKVFAFGKTLKKERLNTENEKLSNSKTNKISTDAMQIKKRNVKNEHDIKRSLTDNNDQLMEDETTLQNEKLIFRERKKKYQKKVSLGQIDREKLTMFDLIFWNPATNPMPGRTDVPKKKFSASAKSDADDAASDIVEEQMVDDLGLDGKATEVAFESNNPESPFKEHHQEELLSLNGCEDDKDDDKTGSGVDIFAPQVKIGPNGQIILDEQSIKIQTTAAKNRDEILSKAEVVEETNDTAHYGKWSKKRRRSCEWTEKETARFYKALSTVGTDFSLMETLFKWRSRAELKTKFKKEERNNRFLVDRALKDCTQFDFSLFEEESDYDPEEDRKATRIAEREEAKRKRLEMKHTLREEQKIQKRLAAKEKKIKNRKKIKSRKSLLRKIRDGVKYIQKDFENEAGTKGEAEDTMGLDLKGAKNETDRQVLKANRSKAFVHKQKSNHKKRLPKKEEKQSNPKSMSLVISEIVVTMETTKCNDTSLENLPATELTVDEMALCNDPTLLQSPSTDPIAVEDEQYAVDRVNNCSPVLSLYSNTLHGTLTDNASVPVTMASDMTGSEIYGNESQEYIPLSAVRTDSDFGTIAIFPSSPYENLEDKKCLTVAEEKLDEVTCSSSQITVTDSSYVADIPPHVSPTTSSASASSQMLFTETAELNADHGYQNQYPICSNPVNECQEENLIVAEQDQKVWEFPVSAVEVHSDGKRTVSVPTTNGQKSLPIPYIPPGTSGVMVVATTVEDNPGEYIYHVYTISPTGS